jgi:hypothetical protein
MMHDLLPPPSSLPREPERMVLRAGTKLFRVHHRDYRCDAFNAKVEDVHFLGSRFGGTAEDRYPILYAALAPDTAIAETLLHDAVFRGDPVRVLPSEFVAGFLLSALYLNADVELVSLLNARALAAVGATSWLVDCDRDQYPRSRHWGHWIRTQAPWAQGFIWHSKRDVDRPSLVLTGDRVGEAARVDFEPVVVPDRSERVLDFAKEDDVARLNELLEPYQATVMT